MLPVALVTGGSATSALQATNLMTAMCSNPKGKMMRSPDHLFRPLANSSVFARWSPAA
jgi:hypothetical protein